MYQIYFILELHLTCLGRSFRPSSGVRDCTYSNRHLSNRYCCLLASRQQYLFYDMIFSFSCVLLVLYRYWNSENILWILLCVLYMCHTQLFSCKSVAAYSLKSCPPPHDDNYCQLMFIARTQYSKRKHSSLEVTVEFISRVFLVRDSNFRTSSIPFNFQTLFP